jgi:hypothetical protein
MSFLLTLIGKTHKLQADELQSFTKGNFGAAFLKIKGREDYDNQILMSHSRIQGLDEIRLNKLNKQVFKFCPINNDPHYITMFVNNKNEVYPGQTITKNEQDIANDLGYTNRKIDSESKIIEHLHKIFKGDFSISGEINLYTDRIPCPSCSEVLNRFSEDYSNIKLIVYYVS